MILTQHYLACLSHASYLVGDETTGRAVVVDPRRDVGVYLGDAAAHGVSIERVIETHMHADFLSGHLELAAQRRDHLLRRIRRGAFPIEPLRDGQRLSLGEVTLEVLATPGHTPESICVVVYEHPDDEVPYGVLTGDSLFVGDVGRPDLLASAGAGLSAEMLARQLYRSLREKLLRLPDATRVFPAHGAGSSCGKQLSNETNSTIGEQQRTNSALQPMSVEEFVTAVTEGQPVRPEYFAYDARRNRELHPLLDEHAAPPLLDLDDVLARRAAGAVLLDPREPAQFAAAHLRGAVNIGLQGRFAEWSGDVLSPDRDIVLVGDPELAPEATVRLARVGFDVVVGQLADLPAALAARPDLAEASSRLMIEQLAELRGLEPDLQLIDVRNPGETAAGILRGAREIALAEFTRWLVGLEPADPVVVYCASGYRSQVVASLLRSIGFRDVSDLLGGYRARAGAGLPVAHGATGPQPGPTPEVGPAAAKAQLDGGGVLLDVRETVEWVAGHAPGASALPMRLVHEHRPELPRHRRILVICRTGGRSAAVTDALCG